MGLVKDTINFVIAPFAMLWFWCGNGVYLIFNYLVFNLCVTGVPTDLIFLWLLNFL